MPTWQIGQMITRIRSMRIPGAANVFSFDAAGERNWAAAIWYPDSAEVTLLDLAGGKDGTVAVVGWAISSKGARAHFLAILDAQGKLVSTTRTNPHAPAKVAITPDGNIWTFGENAAEGNLVCFSPQGKQRFALLARDTFGGREHPTFDMGYAGAYLRASGAGVALLTAAASEWIRVEASGQIAERKSLAAFPVSRDGSGKPALLAGFAATADGASYALFDDTVSTALYRLDTKTGAFVRHAPENRRFTYLLGAEGQDLVLRERGDAAGLVRLRP